MIDAIAVCRKYVSAHPSLLSSLLFGHLHKAFGRNGRGCVPEELSEAFIRTEVTSTGQFSADWFSPNIAHLYPALRGMCRPFERYLEIGVYEGLSTVWFGAYLRKFGRCPNLVCIDPFFGHETVGEERGVHIEANFDHNVAQFLGDLTVRKIKDVSQRVLPEMIESGERFDVIYVDGSHHTLDVMTDAVMAWRLLEENGLLIFDDYFWQPPDVYDRPLPAVNCFLDLIAGQFRVVDCYHQVIVEKRVPV
ncbi:MAG: class I SAM-dependent methyltransferase [Rhodospirillales bacterium]|nr:class I SAM-dependent methyltransferase [Rhodospirillales bacterium]